jgi:hypothetical protein
MDITTVNVIIGCTLAFIGSAIIFILGTLVTYIRSINKSLKELLLMAQEHKTRLDQIDKHLEYNDKRIDRLEENV